MNPLPQMVGHGPFENTRTGEVFWLGPGVAIPYNYPGDTFRATAYAQAVLDAIGREVERGLTWEWPTAKPPGNVKDRIAYLQLVLGEVKSA